MNLTNKEDQNLEKILPDMNLNHEIQKSQNEERLHNLRDNRISSIVTFEADKNSNSINMIKDCENIINAKKKTNKSRYSEKMTEKEQFEKSKEELQN